MKKRISYVIAVASALAITSYAMLPASATDEKNCNVKIYSVGTSVNSQDICSALNSSDLQSVLEKYGCTLNCEQNTTPPIVDTKPEDTTEPDSENNSGNQGTGNESTDNNESNVSEYEKRVAELVNEIRVENGISPLTLNSELSNVARIKSQDMKDNQYFSHTSPVYGSPFDMIKNFGISYKTAGENIARGQQTPEAVVDAWMNSDGHRANILNSSFTEIGVGYVADGNYWTQMFIG